MADCLSFFQNSLPFQLTLISACSTLSECPPVLLTTVQVLCSILDMEAFSNKEPPWERKPLANLGKLLKNAHVLMLDHGVGGMGINKDQPNESKGYLFWASYSKGVSHQHLCLAETHRQAEEMGSFIAENRGGSGLPWVEAVGGLTPVGKLVEG